MANMKEDLYLVTISSEYTYLSTWMGSFHPDDQDDSEDRLLEIESELKTKYGKRAYVLIKELRSWSGRRNKKK